MVSPPLLILALALPLGSPGTPAAPRRVVFGTVSVSRDTVTGRISGRIDPVAIYENGRYGDAVVAGDQALNLLLRRTILNTVKKFGLYRRGVHAGTFTVERLKTEEVCGGGKQVFGVGNVAWDNSPADPTGEYDAVSLAFRTQRFFYASQTLTAYQRAAVLDAAKSELKNRTPLPNAEPGKRIVPRGDVIIQSTEILDVRRNGVPQVLAIVDAPLLEPKTSPDEGISMRMLLVVETSTKPPALLLSLRTLYWRDNATPGSLWHRFETVLDTEGDGTGKLILSRDYYEGTQTEIYALRGARFVHVFAGLAQGC